MPLIIIPVLDCSIEAQLLSKLKRQKKFIIAPSTGKGVVTHSVLSQSVDIQCNDVAGHSPSGIDR